MNRKEIREAIERVLNRDPYTPQYVTPALQVLATLEVAEAIEKAAGPKKHSCVTGGPLHDFRHKAGLTWACEACGMEKVEPKLGAQEAYRYENLPPELQEIVQVAAGEGDGYVTAYEAKFGKIG